MCGDHVLSTGTESLTLLVLRLLSASCLPTTPLSAFTDSLDQDYTSVADLLVSLPLSLTIITFDECNIDAPHPLLVIACSECEPQLHLRAT